jgi:peroxisomal membrane protein 2
LHLHLVDTRIPTGTLCFLQEVLGSKIAGAVPKVNKNASSLTRALASAYIDGKAAKMALYGFLVSAPLSHYLVGALQKAFAGKTSSRDRIRQIIASNLLISPVQVAGLCHLNINISLEMNTSY